MKKRRRERKPRGRWAREREATSPEQGAAEEAAAEAAGREAAAEAASGEAPGGRVGAVAAPGDRPERPPSAGPVPVREGMRQLRPADPAAAERRAEAAPGIEFQAKGQRWIARPAGQGSGGTGQFGAAYIEAVHFYRAEDPERPLREALLPRGRFAGLFDEELRTLLERAVEIPESGGAGAERFPASR